MSYSAIFPPAEGNESGKNGKAFFTPASGFTKSPTQFDAAGIFPLTLAPADNIMTENNERRRKHGDSQV